MFSAGVSVHFFAARGNDPKGLSVALAILSRLESRLARYGAFKTLVYELGEDLLKCPS